MWFLTNQKQFIVCPFFFSNHEKTKINWEWTVKNYQQYDLPFPVMNVTNHIINHMTMWYLTNIKWWHLPSIWVDDPNLFLLSSSISLLSSIKITFKAPFSFPSWISMSDSSSAKFFLFLVSAAITSLLTALSSFFFQFTSSGSPLVVSLVNCLCLQGPKSSGELSSVAMKVQKGEGYVLVNVWGDVLVVGYVF